MKAEEFQQLERAARKVNKRFTERVRVQITFAGNREPLCNLLNDRIGGRLSEALDALRRYEGLSLKDLVDAWREGGDALAKKYKITSDASRSDRSVARGDTHAAR